LIKEQYLFLRTISFFYIPGLTEQTLIL